MLIYKDGKYKNKNIERKYLNTWYDLLINYILDPKKLQVDLKMKVQVFLRQTHINKPCMGEERD